MLSTAVSKDCPRTLYHRWWLVLVGALLSTCAWSGSPPESNPSIDTLDRQVTSKTISGRITLVSEKGELIDDPREFARAVAYFEPADTSEVELADQRAELTTARRQFRPRVLLVQAGTEVVFPNEDPILHNVFSSSPGNQFDLGHYGQDPGKTHRFTTPGLVRVFCNVHPAMSAHIVVVNSPHFIHPNRDGHFRLEDIPAVAGMLTLWHERSEPKQIRFEPGQTDTDLGEVELALTVRELRPQRERLRRPARRGRY